MIKGELFFKVVEGGKRYVRHERVKQLHGEKYIPKGERQSPFGHTGEYGQLIETFEYWNDLTRMKQIMCILMRLDGYVFCCRIEGLQAVTADEYLSHTPPFYKFDGHLLDVCDMEIPVQVTKRHLQIGDRTFPLSSHNKSIVKKLNDQINT